MNGSSHSRHDGRTTPVQFRWDMPPLPHEGIQKENVALGPSFGVAMSATIDVERAVNERYGPRRSSSRSMPCCPVEYNPEVM